MNAWQEPASNILLHSCDRLTLTDITSLFHPFATSSFMEDVGTTHYLKLLFLCGDGKDGQDFAFKCRFFKYLSETFRWRQCA